MEAQRDICHSCAHFFYQRVIYQDSRVISPFFGRLCHLHHYHSSHCSWLNSTIHAELNRDYFWDWIMADFLPTHCFHTYENLVHVVNHPNWISFQIKGVQCPTVFYRGLHWAAFDRWLQRVLHRPSLSLCLQLHPALDYCIVHAHQLFKGLHPKAPTTHLVPQCKSNVFLRIVNCISLERHLYFIG